jgi:hypothetical protein
MWLQLLLLHLMLLHLMPLHLMLLEAVLGRGLPVVLWVGTKGMGWVRQALAA